MFCKDKALLRFLNGVFMSEMSAVTVQDLGVKFHLSEQKVDNLKEYVIRILKHQMRYKEDFIFTDERAAELLECATLSATLDERMEKLHKCAITED